MSSAINTQTIEPEVVIPQPIIFTDAAAQKVKQLIEEEGNLNLMLRVYITGGGCSGFQYGFAFEEKANSDDLIIEKWVVNKIQAVSAENDGGSGSDTEGMAVKLLIDPMSLQYLVGAEIDYVEDINGAQFVIRNPNAQTTCGCGSSFNV